jgi:hypothetical protein
METRGWMQRQSFVVARFGVARNATIGFNTSGPQEIASEEASKMRKSLAALVVCCLGIIAFGVVRAAQNKPSPPAQATCDLEGGKSITIDYSSPRMKGRKIFGGLVPYGDVWRAGANQATTFVTTADLMVGGTHVPAGNYTLFAIPDKDKWTLVISKKTGEWGIPYPGQDSDFARVPMKASSLPAGVENFMISLEKGGTGCTLRMEWETTRASVEITKM